MTKEYRVPKLNRFRVATQALFFEVQKAEAAGNVEIRLVARNRAPGQQRPLQVAAFTFGAIEIDAPGLARLDLSLE